MKEDTVTAQLIPPPNNQDKRATLGADSSSI